MDPWYSYNLQRAKNRKRMKEKYNSKKSGRKKAEVKAPDLVPKEYNNVLVYMEEIGNDPEELIFDDHPRDNHDLPDCLVEEEEEQPNRGDNVDLDAVDGDSLGQERLIPGSDNLRIMAIENIQRINDSIDQMDSTSALLCSQAILTLISNFRTPADDQNILPPTEYHLNYCKECGAYYRIVQVHHCGLSQD